MITKTHATVAKVLLVMHALLMERMRWQSDGLRWPSKVGWVVRWAHVVVIGVFIGVVKGRR